MKSGKLFAFFLGVALSALLLGFGLLVNGYTDYRNQTLDLQTRISYINQYCKCDCKPPPRK